MTQPDRDLTAIDPTTSETVTLVLTPWDVSLLTAAMQFCGTFGPSDGFQQNAMKMFARLVALRFRSEMDGTS